MGRSEVKVGQAQIDWNELSDFDAGFKPKEDFRNNLAAKENPLSFEDPHYCTTWS